MAIDFQELLTKISDMPNVDRDSRVDGHLVRDFEFEAGLVASRQERSLAVNLSLAASLIVATLVADQITITEVVFLVLIVALSLYRARTLGAKSLKDGTLSVKRWYQKFGSMTIGLSLLWGALTAYVLVTYGATNKIGFFLILLMAGMSAGALASMTPWKKLSVIYVSCMLGVPITTLTVMDPIGNFAFSIATFTFYFFLVAQAQQLAAMFVTLRDREVRFQTINRFGMEGGLIHRNGEILEVNDAFLQIFNMERSEVFKKHLFDFVRPDFHAQAREKLKEQNNFWEVVCVRPDGSEVPMETWANAIDFGGVPARVVYVRDISARKRIEDALIESERNLKEFMTSAFDSLSDILLVVAKDGKFESVNQKWREYSGLDLDATNGTNFTELVAAEDREGFMRFIRARHNSEQEFSAQLLRKSDNTYRWHLGRSSPVKDRNGVITKWFMLWTDTHDQIQGIKRNHELEVTAKSAREASLVKSAFLANMSHEIRTPLNAIIGLSDLLLELPSSPLQHKYQSTLKNSAESLFEIVNDILDLSKIESGNVVAEEVDFVLAPLVEFQVELMAGRARDKSLSLSSYIDPAIPMDLKGDSTRVAQVVLNLLSNAVKFTKTGGVAVRAKLLYANDEEVFVRLEVEDTGIGMSADEQTKLFKPFSQVDASHTRKYGGTGLGLSICLGLIQVMNGRVFVHSETGHGSLFVVDLPFKLDRKKLAESRTQSSDIVGEAKKEDPKTVLLIDSAPLAFEAKFSYLQDWNRRCVNMPLAALALNGLQAIGEAEFMIVDTSLSPSDFEKAVQWLRELPSGFHRKVILVGDESVRHELASLNLGEEMRFLAKPIKHKEFKDLIDGNFPQISKINRVQLTETPAPRGISGASVGLAESGSAAGLGAGLGAGAGVATRLSSGSQAGSMSGVDAGATVATSAGTNGGSSSTDQVYIGAAKPVDSSAAAAAPSGNIPTESTAAQAPAPSSAMSSKQILVVEDNTTNQLLIKALLKKIGYDPHVVANGVEAIDALKDKKFDLILMDCQMPEMDGFEATERIRATEMAEKTIKKIRIIALTANVRVEDRARCFAVGMDDFLSKPVRREALVEKLDQWLAA